MKTENLVHIGKHIVEGLKNSGCNLNTLQHIANYPCLFLHKKVDPEAVFFGKKGFTKT
jgi:hypothetical protein